MALFEYVAVLGDNAKAHVRVVSLDGISTKHGNAKTDRGRLYGRVTFAGLVYTLQLYSDVGRGADKLVAQGTTSELGAYFDLAQQLASGITGRAVLASYAQDYAGLVLVPTFAVDRDVAVDQPSAKALGGPGYDDAAYGLAEYHAAAMRTLVCSDLPAQVPHLFGKIGTAAFVPTMDGVELPDLRTIAGVDHLRQAQGELVKAMAAEAQEHLEEFAAIGVAARGRYQRHLDNLKAANVVEAEAVDVADSAGVSTSTFTIG